MTGICDQYEDMILDLAYDELNEEDSTSLMEHAQNCSACAARLEDIQLTRRMAAGLEQFHPPLSMDAGILAMADKALRKEPTAVATSPSESTVVSEPSFFEKLHGALFRPALATAGIAAAVAATLFLVNRGEAPAVFPTAAISETATAPASPSRDALADASVHLQSEETEKEISEPIPAPGTARLEARAAATASARHRAPTEAASNLPYSDPPKSLRSEEVIGAVKPPVAPEKKRDILGGSSRIDGDRDKAISGGASPSLEARVPTPSSPSDISFSPAPSAGSATGGSASFASGLAAYNRGNCTAAIADFQAVLQNPSAPPSDIPAAHHYIARCENRMGRCAKAVGHFDTVIQRYPGYADRPAAIYEAADCHVRLGNQNRARALLEELRNIPAWRTRAESKLRELD